MLLFAQEVLVEKISLKMIKTFFNVVIQQSFEVKKFEP